MVPASLREERGRLDSGVGSVLFLLLTVTFAADVDDPPLLITLDVHPLPVLAAGHGAGGEPVQVSLIMRAQVGAGGPVAAQTRSRPPGPSSHEISTEPGAVHLDLKTDQTSIMDRSHKRTRAWAQTVHGLGPRWRTVGEGVVGAASRFRSGRSSDRTIRRRCPPSCRSGVGGEVDQPVLRVEGELVGESGAGRGGVYGQYGLLTALCTER